jgi:hypothetical protein
MGLCVDNIASKVLLEPVGICTKKSKRLKHKIIKSRNRKEDKIINLQFMIISFQYFSKFLHSETIVANKYYTQSPLW